MFINSYCLKEAIGTSCFWIVLFSLLHCTYTRLHSHQVISTADIVGSDVFFEIIDPIELEYTYRIRPAKDFGPPFNESFRIQHVPLVLMNPSNGCDEPINVEEIEGNVTLIERGDCSFKTKALTAERAGARAVIITDTFSVEDDYIIEMIDDDTEEEVRIPAGFLMGKNGIFIIKTLQRLGRDYAIINLPVNLTFTPVNEINEPPLGW